MNSYWLTNAIVITLALFAMIFNVNFNINAFKTASKSTSQLSQGPMDSMRLSFLSSAFFASICGCASFVFLIYKYWHYSWMIMAFGDNKLRKSVFGTSTWDENKFANEWDTNKQMINWLCICLFLSALIFCYMMYVSLYSSPNRYETTRYGLYFGIIWLAVYSMKIIIYGVEASNYADLSVIQSDHLKGSAIFFIVIGSVGLALCLINWVFNI